MNPNPNDPHGFEAAEAAAAFARSRLPASAPAPRTALVLGSGLGDLANEAKADPASIAIPYAEIPGFAAPSVEGHAGILVVGPIGGVPTLVFQGRAHHYEGHPPERVAFPTRVAARLGVRTLILTASTGGVADGLAVGDLVLIDDHLNLMGANPLRGPNDPRFGPRFPDMTEVYAKRLRALARDAATREGLALKSGVYAAMPGPSYETPAEIRMLRALGADVVGMSTVPEAIAARHAGLEVLAFAVVTNAAAGLSDHPLDHEEVTREGRRAGQRLGRLIRAVVQSLDA